jgi:hypothetical protein
LPALEYLAGGGKSSHTTIKIKIPSLNKKAAWEQSQRGFLFANISLALT